MKKTISIILAVIMLFGAFTSISAYAFEFPGIDIPDIDIPGVDVLTISNVSLRKNSTSLESLDVVNGATPCFDIMTSASISGTGSLSLYAVDTDYMTYPFIKGVSWYDETDKVYLNESSQFVSGHKYTVKIRVKAKDKYEFNSELKCELYSNGEYSECGYTVVEAKKIINVEKVFVCTGVTEIESVYINGIITPVSGKTPSALSVYMDTSSGAELDTDEDADYISNRVKWVCVSDGNAVMTKDDLFVKDKEYRAYIRLKAKAGYEFKTESASKSAVVASIGGNDGEIVATGDKSLSEYITVYNSVPYICAEDPDISIEIDISKGNVTTVTELKTDYTYNGKAQNAEVEVKYTALTLKEGEDYQIVYSGNHTDAGEVNYEIQGIGKYVGSIPKSFVIKPLKATPSVTLSATKYTYDGNVKKPTVTVSAAGKKLKTGDYLTSYKSGKNVGNYSVTVTLMGNYSGKKTAAYVINPKGTALTKKKTCKKDSITVNWTKQSTQTTGYEIEYSTSSKFSGSKKVNISKNTTVSKKITGLKKNKQYYFRIRTYKKLKTNGKTEYFYSSWSASKAFKTTSK